MFKIYDGRESFYQWDLERKLIVNDKSISQIHFCDGLGSKSIIRYVYEVNGIYLADVPNISLQKDGRLKVYGYDNTYTKHSAVFDVIKRSKPEDYVYTDEEIRVWDELENRIEALESGENIVVLEPAYDDIPKVFFDEAIPQTKDDVKTKFRYISKTMDFSGYAEFKAQGNSSMGFPKKNMTVKMYADEALENKLKVDFKGWGKQNKHCYKANWVDLTHARNIVSARLWGDVVRSRANYDTLPLELRESPNFGAVDGFPVKVYSQGIYQGRYTINIPKDAWMANMDDDLDNHCILCGEDYNSASFRAEAMIDGSDWTDEIHDVVPEAIKTRWNEVINFVMNSSDEEFISEIGNYFDLESIIDYFIYGMVICNMDGFSKNQLYDTYDGLKWYATVYDLDSTFGTYFDVILPYDYPRNSYEDIKDGTRQGNLLFIRLVDLFTDRIKERYAELKAGALSLPNIINHFERFTDITPNELVKEDYATTTANGAFTAIPLQEQSNIQQIRNYIVNRYDYVDNYMAQLGMKGQLIYKLENPATVNATAWTGQIETDVKLFDEPKSFTLICEATLDENNELGKNLWSISNEYLGWENPEEGAHFLQAKVIPGEGLYFTGQTNSWCEPIFGNYETGKSAINSLYSKHAIVVKDGVPTDLYFITEENGAITHNNQPVGNVSYLKHDGILCLGEAMYSYGGNNLVNATIHDFEVWDYAMDENEINKVLGGK